MVEEETDRNQLHCNFVTFILLYFFFSLLSYFLKSECQGPFYQKKMIMYARVSNDNVCTSLEETVLRECVLLRDLYIFNFF